MHEWSTGRRENRIARASRTSDGTAPDMDRDCLRARRSLAPFLKARDELSRMGHTRTDGSWSAEHEIAEEPRSLRTRAVPELRHDG